MKKITLTLLLISILTTLSVSQITINRSDLGNIGDKFYFRTDTSLSGVSCGARGSNVVWDFSSSVGVNYYDSTMFLDPITFPNMPLGSNLVSVNSANGGDTTFLELSTNVYKIHIPVDQIPFPLSKTSLKVMGFPSSYLSANVDSIKGGLAGTPADFGITGLPAIVDSVRINMSFIAISLIDGWGKLITPMDQYASVLRLRLVVNTNSRFDIHTILTGWSMAQEDKTSDTSYTFLGQNSKTDLMSINTDTLGNPVEIRYRVGAVYPAAINEVSKENSFTIFPNPASDKLTISFALNLNANAEISLVDVTGKEVKHFENGNLKSGENRISFSTDGLEKGIYFCQIKGEGINAVKKVIIRK